jgi:anti-anti-sigma factor
MPDQLLFDQARDEAAVSAVAESPSSLAVAARTEQSVAVLTVDGILDAGSSAALRHSIMKATLQGPSAVIVDVNALQVPAESAWSAFLGVRWQVETHPDVPIVLVCAHRATREAITRSGVARFMPVYATEKGAMKAISRLARRTVQRADAQLPPNLTSLRESRRLVREWLTGWSQPRLIPVSLVVVNVFVENVRPGDARRERRRDRDHSGLRWQQRARPAAALAAEGHRRVRPGDRRRVVTRLG